jgi:ubiquitin carboxyl-terminal hydrolase L3
MTRLAHRLGLSENLVFQDVYSLTEPELLALVPRPCHALLFLFPITTISEESFAKEEAAMGKYDSAGPDEPVLWFHQTIGHACGLIGLLHCLTNGEAANHITPGSHLEKIVQDAIPAKPEARAAQLYNSNFLEIAHKESANEGDSVVPEVGDEVPYGFTAFVKGKDGHVWELEGRRKGPVDRGVVEADEDVLSHSALTASVLRHINREKAAEGRFSCLALVNADG